jgi:hypothetical protein
MVEDRAPVHDQLMPYADDGQTPDPAPWLPTKALMIIAGIAVIALIVTIVVCLLLWITPPLQPMDVPSVPAA